MMQIFNLVADVVMVLLKVGERPNNSGIVCHVNYNVLDLNLPYMCNLTHAMSLHFDPFAKRLITTFPAQWIAKPISEQLVKICESCLYK